jgi:signal transduction histidine kinase
MIRRRSTLALARMPSTTLAARVATALPASWRALLHRRPASAQHRAPAAVHPADPSSQLFRRIRVQLTLWFCGVLAAMLLVGGILLYFAVQQALLGPVPGYLSESAQLIGANWAHQWDQQGPTQCDDHGIPIAAVQHVPYIFCVANGGPPETLGGGPYSFYTTNLVQAATASPSGQASDTIIGENGLGAVRRYALVVHNLDDGSVIGVVQVGIPIQGSLDALHALLITLLLVGALTIAGAAVAGRWLSARAMEPAQLSFARQQAFIGDAAHELRTPLTIMRADAEVLLRGRQRLDPDDVELLEDIVNETAHMGALATNLLTLARLDAGRLQLEHDVVDLAEIAAAVSHRVAVLAKERHTTVVVEATHALTLGDQAQLEQAALILVDNAVKYNRPDGTVTIRVSQDTQRALFVVQDTGIGIPPEHLPHLGERFYRVDKARSREAGGAGLGLSIARGIVAAHGGTLTFDSEPGSGTTATISLPAAK